MIGIYCIKNNLTDECYIGQSVNIAARWLSHKRDMSSKKYSLYSDMRFYGVENFTFSILEECDKPDLDRREMYWIKKFQEDGYHLYNIVGVPEKERIRVKRNFNKRPSKKYR